MADPVSIMMLVNASFGVTRSLVHTIKELYELAEAYETAALGIRTIATQCNSFRVAVQRISKWLETQNDETRDNLDEDFWQALAQNLETARMVMDDLDKRIVGLKKTPNKFWTRTKYLWNGVVISELQTQIGGLMTAVSILVQVIDIPTTGGKRSYSLAHKNRLTRLTKSVRHNVDEERARIRARQERNLLDDAIPDADLPVLEHAQTEPDMPVTARVNGADSASSTRPVPRPRAVTVADPEVTATVRSESQSQLAVSDLAVPDTAPPPYDFVVDGTLRAEDDRWYLKNGRKKSAGDEKAKPGFWKAARASKTNSTSGFASLFSSSKSLPLKKQSASSKPDVSASASSDAAAAGDDKEPATVIARPVQPSLKDSTYQLQQTPAPIETGDKEYFQLQLAMSGMGMTSSDLSAVERDPSRTDFPSAPAELASNYTAQPLVTVEPEGHSQAQFSIPRNPITTQSAPSTVPTVKPKPTYHDKIIEPSQKFERLRPSQRVKESREREQPQSPDSGSQSQLQSRQNTISSLDSNDSLNLERLDSRNKLSSLSFSSSNNLQDWITHPMPSHRVRFRVQFEDDSFTNKMSMSAARTLGVNDYIVEYAGIPTTTLTMLYSVEDECVSDDEVEFVVMDEYEQRTPLLVLGAGLAHLKGLMREGEYIYWDSQPIPKKLRTVDRLRLYRRFELVRW